jgi:mono/diheme cytochrome c family protein
MTGVGRIRHFWITLPLVFVALSSCSKYDETPVMQYMPHMATTPILKAMRGYDGFGNGSSMLVPPEHSVARGHRPYHYASVEEAEKGFTKNPLPRSMAVLSKGQKIFNTYCIACHGPRGYGDGPVVNPFPIPKSLQSADMMKWNDGHIYHVITKGQGVMPSYAQQIQPDDRWAVIHYVRALQRAEHPTDEDIRILESDEGEQK